MNERRRSTHMNGKRSKRSLIAGAAFAVAAILTGVTACGSGGGDGSTAKKSVKDGLITKTDSNPFFIKNLGSQGVKGIMITPNSSSGILASIKKARDQGVLVVALDTATDPENAVDATFATDNFAAGVAQGAWVKARLGTTTPQVLMLDGTPGGTVDTFRHDGFLKGFGLTANSPAIVGMENTNGDQTKAQTAMENLLQRAPQVNALYTINEPAAAGAYAAIKAAGKQNDILIGSIDGSCTGVKNVKEGIMGATVMQFPTKMATLGVEAIVAFAKDGTKPKAGFNDTGSVLITDKPVSGIDSKDTTWGASNCWG